MSAVGRVGLHCKTREYGSIAFLAPRLAVSLSQIFSRGTAEESLPASRWCVSDPLARFARVSPKAAGGRSHTISNRSWGNMLPLLIRTGPVVQIQQNNDNSIDLVIERAIRSYSHGIPSSINVFDLILLNFE